MVHLIPSVQVTRPCCMSEKVIPNYCYPIPSLQFSDMSHFFHLLFSLNRIMSQEDQDSSDDSTAYSPPPEADRPLFKKHKTRLADTRKPLAGLPGGVRLPLRPKDPNAIQKLIAVPFKVHIHHKQTFEIIYSIPQRNRDPHSLGNPPRLRWVVD
jgi:hypothetical protein